MNKDWEFEPFIKMIKNQEGIGKITKENVFVRHPLLNKEDSKYPDEPSLVYENENFIFNFRCIAYLAANTMADGEIEYEGRCTDSKLKGIMKALSEDKPDYIISVSTAESTDYIEEKCGRRSLSGKSSLNGSVIMGKNFFITDEKDEDIKRRYKLKEDKNGNVIKKSYKWNDMPFCDRGYAFISSKDDPDFFACVDKTNGRFTELYEAEFNPDPVLTNMYLPHYISIGAQNISNYESYPEADADACEKFKKWRAEEEEKGALKHVCIETAHGVVAYAAAGGGPMLYEMTTKCPIVFVSPIVDRYKSFNADVKDYQNRVGATNAGIIVGKLLKVLSEEFTKK